MVWRVFRDLPITWKVALSLVAWSVPLLLLTAAISAQLGRQHERDARAEVLVSRAEAVAGVVDALHRTYREGALALARREELARVLAAGDGEVGARTRAVALLDDEVGALGAAAAALVDADGRVVVANTPTLLGTTPTLVDAPSREVGETFTELAGVTSEPVLAYATPVRVRGVVRGRAVVWAFAGRFWDLLQRSNNRAGAGSYAIVFDAWGLRAGHSLDRELVFRPTEPLSAARREALTRTQRLGRWTDRALQPLPFDSMGDARRGEVYRRYSSATRVWILSVGRALEIPGWMLVYSIPESSVQAYVTRVLQVTLGTSLVGVLFAIAAAALVSGRLSRPVTALARAVDAIAQGRYDVSVEGLADDELGRLAGRFRAMAQSLGVRTRELEQRSQDLAAARDAALDASRLKSEFLATMSHEIRTPLHGVLGSLELLEGTSLDAEQGSYVTMAAHSGALLLAIVNDILDFSKIEANRIELDDARFDLRALCTDLVASFADDARRRGLSLQLHLADDLPQLVAGDPTRLRQVLVNLVGNALKFTPQGSVSLTVSATVEGERVRCRYEVRDTGIGLAPEVLPRIFEAFRQADGSTTRRFGGTGLGLAICERLVHLQGGAIGVESEPGRGSVFWFELPAAWWAARASASAAPVEVSGASMPANDAGEVPPAMRVLVVEDNPVNQRVIARMLEKRGCAVTVAENGARALDALEHARVDLVLMDCQMPEMDGFEATRRIRARERERGGHVPIVALTANAARGDQERCREAGMDDYLTKPLVPGALDTVLRGIARASSHPGPAHRDG